MNGIFANYFWTMFWRSVFWIFWLMWFFPRKYKYRCISVYGWSKDDKYVIWMWIWLVLKNISLLDRIWSLWLVCFAHSPTNFIFWLGRLIFSVSINSHQDNIYLYSYKVWGYIGIALSFRPSVHIPCKLSKPSKVFLLNFTQRSTPYVDVHEIIIKVCSDINGWI